MKRALIIGAGISGLGAAKILRERKWEVILADLNEPKQADKEALEAIHCLLYVGSQSKELMTGVDMVVVSPSIPRENPVVAEALKRHVPVISEVELAYRIAKAPIFGITGTNGKTTTTTLLGHMIKEEGIPCSVAGNIGVSLSVESEKVPEKGIIVAEISSFQLEFINDFRPKIAAILNITPDHIERHHTMDAYVEAKARIFENMRKEDALLLNASDPYAEQLAKQAEIDTKVYFFSSEKELEEGAFLTAGRLTLCIDNKIVDLCGVNELSIYGRPNVENALAASFMAYMGGISVKSIRRALRAFTVLPHRLEKVRELEHVIYYDDSKATNTDAAIKGIESFEGPVVLIAGGYDKGTDLTELMMVVKAKVKHMILIGAAAERFAKEASKRKISDFSFAKDMKEAVHKSRLVSEAGDVVLLAPACSSFDMYKSYSVRGDDFKQIVKALK